MAEHGGRGATPPPVDESFFRNRAVVSDDNHTIRLMFFAPGLIEPLGVVELSPEQSVRLCADIFAAAAAHLARPRRPMR